jgi:hypothetical protein
VAVKEPHQRALDSDNYCRNRRLFLRVGQAAGLDEHRGNVGRRQNDETGRALGVVELGQQVTLLCECRRQGPDRGGRQAAVLTPGEEPIALPHAAARRWLCGEQCPYYNQPR